MRWLTEHDYPSPRLVDETDSGLVMERIEGPTMLEALSSRTIRPHLRTLAALHAELHTLPSPPGLTTPYGEGSALLHGDLHPGNVILADRGPVVIDWTNACVGPAGADVAEAWLLLACAGIPERRLAGITERVLRRVAVRVFVSAAGRHGEAEAARAALDAVLAHRRRDPNMTPVELARMSRLVRREAR